MRKLFVSIVVFGTLVVGSVGIAAASPTVPFHLAGSGTITATSGVQSGEVIGTHIGRGDALGVFFLTGPVTPCSAGSTTINTLGLQELTAADGSTIDQRLDGVTCQSGPSSFRTTSTYTMLSGTGRFMGVSGTGTHVRESDFSTIPGTFAITQDGTIDLGKH